MLNELYELLNKYDLNIKNAYKSILKYKDDELCNIVQALDEALISNNDDLVDGTSHHYNFVSNKSLSGGISGCGEIECRLKRAEQLAKFAALYADIILINNPFELYLEYASFNNTLRTNLLNDIIILWYFKPLINKGIIRFSQNSHQFCMECLNRFSKGKFYNYENKVKKARQFLVNEYLRNVEYYFISNSKHGYLEIIGPEELVEHGTRYVLFSEYTPKEFLKYKSLDLRNKIDNKTLLKSEFLSFSIKEELNEYALQEWYTKNFDYYYLTNREIETKLIHNINDEFVNAYNEYLYDALSHELPIFNGIDINDTIKIRENDKESFNLYRNSMKTLMKEITVNGTYNVKEAFMDIVNPEITKINISVKESQKTILKNIGKNMIIIPGLIYIGLNSGLLPDNIKDISSYIGGFELARGTIKDISELFSKPQNLRENPYYFLYKLNKKANNIDM